MLTRDINHLGLWCCAMSWILRHEMTIVSAVQFLVTWSIKMQCEHYVNFCGIFRYCKNSPLSLHNRKLSQVITAHFVYHCTVCPELHIFERCAIPLRTDRQSSRCVNGYIKAIEQRTVIHGDRYTYRWSRQHSVTRYKFKKKNKQTSTARKLRRRCPLWMRNVYTGIEIHHSSTHPGDRCPWARISYKEPVHVYSNRLSESPTIRKHSYCYVIYISRLTLRNFTTYRNIAEMFKSLTRMQQHYTQTSDRQTDDIRTRLMP